MRLTRYFQSCLLVEEASARILIDPSGEEARDVGKFGRLDAVLFTHEHSDHFDASLAKTFVEEGIAPVYANESTAKQVDASVAVVNDGQEFDVNGVEVKVFELPHCPMPNGSTGPQNSGYLVANKFFHPGDGVEIDNLKAEVVAMPITGPDVSMKDAFLFAKQLEARLAIPIHYDKLGAIPEVYAAFAAYFPDDFAFTVRPLAIGETTQV